MEVVFKQTFATMWDLFCSEVVPQSAKLVPKVVLLSALQMVEHPKMDIPFLPFDRRSPNCRLSFITTVMMEIRSSLETVAFSMESYFPNLGPGWKCTGELKCFNLCFLKQSTLEGMQN